MLYRVLFLAMIKFSRQFIHKKSLFPTIRYITYAPPTPLDWLAKVQPLPRDNPAPSLQDTQRIVAHPTHPLTALLLRHSDHAVFLQRLCEIITINNLTLYLHMLHYIHTIPSILYYRNSGSIRVHLIFVGYNNNKFL